jgi:hypothetical protein
VISLLTLLLAVLAISSSTPFGVQSAAAQEIKSTGTGKIQLAQAWIRELFGTGVAPGPPDQSPRDEEIAPKRKEHRPPRLQRPTTPFAGTYRTVCVRLCDGFYFPISFSTYRSHFQKDAQRCEQSCPNRSRLFAHPTGVSDEPAHMKDLQGNHYEELPNAYRAQKQYVADCNCHGNPWDWQEVARHRPDETEKRVADPGKSRAATLSPRRAASDAP